MKKLFYLFLSIMLLTVLSCAKPPQETIDSAGTSVEEAKLAEAADYAPESMKAVEDAQAALQAELDAQEQKFGLFRSYTKTEELTKSVEEAAQKAKADAITGKEQAIAETEVLIAEAKEAVENAKKMLKKAPRGKGAEADINELKSDIAEAESAITEAEEAYANGIYLEAKAKAEAAKSTAELVSTDIETAIEMKKKLRR
jgi:hypothetical protein